MAGTEAMLNMSSSLQVKHNDPSNEHSIAGTTTSSGNIAHSTGLRSHASIHSETCTTPYHSRAQSPVGDPPRTMEEDLAGVGTRGCQTYQYAEDNPCTTLPRRPLQHQPTTTDSPLDVDSSIGHVDDWSLDKDSCLSDDRDHTIRQDNERLTPQFSSQTSCSEDLTYLGEMFDDTTYVFTEDADSQSESMDDTDIDLERIAGDLLSRWFGIDLDSLGRPFRVIHCLEHVKDQMAAVVEEEGHVLPEDGNEYSEAEEMLDADIANTEPCDVETTGQATSHGRSEAKDASSQSGKDKKRLNNGDLKSSISSELKLATRYPKKKRRTGEQLSCPYRKRNPLRFNVRQHERCALRSYPDITSLKKHLSSDHHKPVHPWRACNRCQQSFQDQKNAISHMQQCRASPQPAVAPAKLAPEDGFDDDVKSRLVSRKDGVKIDDWVSLYKLLFPDADIIPDCNFDPVIEDHDVSEKMNAYQSTLDKDISILVKEYCTDAEAGRRLQQNIQLLVEKRDRKLLERSEITIAGSQIPISTILQGEGSKSTTEEGFVDLGMDSSQQMDLFDNIFAAEEADQISAHYASNREPLEFVNISRIPPSDTSQTVRSTPLVPALRQLDTQPQSSLLLNHTIPIPMISQPEQLANYMPGANTRPQAPHVFSESLFASNHPFYPSSTYMTTLNNQGVHPSATWPSNDVDFNTGQDMDWINETMSYEGPDWGG